LHKKGNGILQLETIDGHPIVVVERNNQCFPD